MTALHCFAGQGAARSIVGMKVTASNSIIGIVIKVLQNNNNEVEAVEIRRDRDYSILAVHNNRIAGIDEELGTIMIN